MNSPSSHGFFLCSCPWSFISILGLHSIKLSGQQGCSVPGSYRSTLAFTERFIITLSPPFLWPYTYKCRIIHFSILYPAAQSSFLPSRPHPVYQFAFSAIICTLPRFTKNRLPILKLSQDLSVQYPLKLLWRSDIMIMQENLEGCHAQGSQIPSEHRSPLLSYP